MTVNNDAKFSYYFIAVSITVLLTACGGGGGGGDVGASTVSATNTAPVANAGADMNALTGALIVLDGSASSDADADPLTYAWNIASMPVGSGATLSNPTNTSPAFTPDLAGEYIIGLVVSDGTDTSTQDTVNITVPASVSHIYDTGWTKCFNNTAEISCPTSGEAFYGQDAQYSTNPLRFSDNASTVTDSIHGLTWQKSDDGKKYNWYQAMGIFEPAYNPGSTDVCGSLSLDGYSDWRLPSRRELVSILNYDTNNYELGLADTNAVQGLADPEYFQSSGTDYWTSTKVATLDPPWAVSGGRVTIGYGGPGSSSFYVRCVRGASWGQNNYADNGDGTITDNMSGLVWQQIDDGVARSWEESLAYCENLSFAGSSDWRLPDVKELASLVTINSSNETLTNLAAVDTTYFPTTLAAQYWSSTSFVSTGESKYAWGVDFSSGWIDWADGPKTDFKFSRCVR